ncbi:MAG TPA: FAD-dependent oxidoreductase [Thermoanaerobaculia bacterium]|nr:FAD-dependent oxidoreductase [Thermoanaerobaculia bacterium]
MRYHRRLPVGKNVVVVGGGLAGLAASIYLARGGRTVTLFEKRRALGGRAVTHLRHGYRFNLGPHAFYRGGAGASVYRELGIPVVGKPAKPKAIALFDGEEFRLPTTILSLLGTSLLSVAGKAQLASALIHIRRFGGSRAGDGTLREWLDARLTNERARAVLESLIRLATYSDHAESESAVAALAQMKVALRGTLYVDEGWQKIVDSLHSAAISSGVNFVSSSRIVGVQHDGGEVRAVELGGLEVDADRMDTQAIAYPEPKPEDVDGARLPAQTVVLAVDPRTAAELTGPAGAIWATARPVTAACLDVALRSLPQPKRTFALGIDHPLYYSVHSAWAQLTPKGGALIHVAKYRKERYATEEELEDSRPRRSSAAAEDEQELEALLDRMQPGWRQVLVHRRFLPAMTVSNALATPGVQRPSPVTNIRGLYLAGDWVGEGMLADAALASARAAAKAILAG